MGKVTVAKDKRIKYCFKVFRGHVGLRLITIIYHLSEILSDELLVRECIQFQCSMLHWLMYARLIYDTGDISGQIYGL